MLGLVGGARSRGLAACKTLAKHWRFLACSSAEWQLAYYLRVLSKKDSRITIETKTEAEKIGSVQQEKQAQKRAPGKYSNAERTECLECAAGSVSGDPYR